MRAVIVVAAGAFCWACSSDPAEAPPVDPGAGGGGAAAGGGFGGVGGLGAGASGGSGASTSAGGAGGASPATMEVVVAVGWQGLRLLSIDEGQTWCQTGLMVDGHDDLFRGAGYHDGLFVGAHAGFENRGAIWTSTDGFRWTAHHRTNEEPSLPDNPSGQWYGGAAWGNGIWMAGGGCGRLATSTDGVTWTEVPRFTQGCLHIRSMTFGEGQFVAGLDDDSWWSSTDGVSWSLHTAGAGSFVVNLDAGLSGPVHGASFYQGRGVCLAGLGSPNYGIQRSEAADCSGAVRVADTAHRPTTFLFGEVPEMAIARAHTGDTLADCLGLP